MKGIAVLFAAGFCLGAMAMDFAALTTPDEVLLDGRTDASRVVVNGDGRILLSGGTASQVKLVWKTALGAETRVLGGMWERTYGDSAWERVDAPTKPRDGSFAWYFLANDTRRTDGYGVRVQPNAFACWQAFPDRIELTLDVRAGSDPVELGSRTLEVCRLVSRKGLADESAFAAGRAFCRMMCPKPRLPAAPVYGYNDWYCAYGRNSATNFLADAAALVGFLDDPARGPRVANRPFLVVDDGWQFRRTTEASEPGVRWASHNATWGMAMDEFARRVKALDARPGLWYRPFVPEAGCRAGAVDPTDPKWARQIREEMARFADWGFELVKIDFITFDWNQVWGYELGASPVKKPLPRWNDRTRTTAEVVRSLYGVMREAAGDRMCIIGCNAIDHFAAGLFELQRTGDDTSGREWERTRKMGPNTLGMRAIHNGTFYQCDGDCVGLVKAGDVPWHLNRQWLELVGRSGTSLFTSWKRVLTDDPDVRRWLGDMWRCNAAPHATAEPLDWLETVRPRRWRFDSGVRTFDWDEPAGR